MTSRPFWQTNKRSRSRLLRVSASEVLRNSSLYWTVRGPKDAFNAITVKWWQQSKPCRGYSNRNRQEYLYAREPRIWGLDSVSHTDTVILAFLRLISTIRWWWRVSDWQKGRTSIMINTIISFIHYHYVISIDSAHRLGKQHATSWIIRKQFRLAFSMARCQKSEAPWRISLNKNKLNRRNKYLLFSYRKFQIN